MSHLSEMLAVFTHEYHYTSPAYKRHTTLRSCGVYCTHACRLSEAMALVAITDILLKINNEIQLCKA